MDRINHTPNFFHFNNQQPSLGNHQSDGKAHSGGLRTPAGLVPPSGLLRVWGVAAIWWLTHTGRSCAALRAFKGVGGPQFGGLRTPAEKCRPPG